jgi:hypothetical protein
LQLGQRYKMGYEANQAICLTAESIFGKLYWHGKEQIK